jgi:chromosome segregation ATPase
MSSSDSATPFVRTTGLENGTVPTRREEVLDSEVRRLRGKVAALQDELAARDERIETLEAELATKRDELESAQQWAHFLDRELTEHRETVDRLESRVDALESDGSGEPSGLLGRLRALF